VAIISAQEVHEELLNTFGGELEALILWLSQYEVEKAGKGKNYLSNETSNNNNTIIRSSWVLDIVNSQFNVEVLKIGNLDNLLLNFLFQFIELMSFSEGCSLFLSLLLGFLKLFLFLIFELNSLLPFVELLNDGHLMFI